MIARYIASAIAFVLLSSCVVVSPLPEIDPGERPAMDTDEAGLWRDANRMEYAIRASDNVFRDPQLQAYLESVLCRVTPDYCSDIRIYVVPGYTLNASMHVNGMMRVSTGALLRWENEAQMATVLGHEVAHYTKRHGLVGYRAVRSISNNTTAVTSVFVAGIGAAAIGAYVARINGNSMIAVRNSDWARTIFRVSLVSNFGLIQAYYLDYLRHSRRHESDADSTGRAWVAGAGYDLESEPEMWAALQSEIEAAPRKPPRLEVFRSHPKPEVRASSAEEDARVLRRENPDADRLGREEYMRQVEPFRHAWLQYARGGLTPKQDAALLKQQREIGAAAGLVLFHEAQMQRKRNKKGDRALAIATFRAALQHGGHPPETHRELGLALWGDGETEEARQAFERYLTDRPDALDHAMVRQYVADLHQEAAGE